ncbi:hypothetical protein R1flu_027303 [Riccia fluitans]|uniref:Uncharacterized protein n=1 Tax=Riccia fluitans TaxID=41844 RepID=A0ABD1XII6_9MARC
MIAFGYITRMLEPSLTSGDRIEYAMRRKHHLNTIQGTRGGYSGLSWASATRQLRCLDASGVGKRQFCVGDV